MAKYIFISIFVIGAAILLYFLLHEPKQPDSYKYGYEQAETDLKIVKEQRDVGLHKIDSLESASRSKDSVIASLRVEKLATQKELDKTTAGATRLAKEVKILRKGDTSDFAIRCDSLAEQAQNFSYLYNQYKDYSDSLTSVMESQLNDYTAALAEQKKLYDELYMKYEQLNKLFDNVYKDYSSVKKTVKRERLKTKIAALLALIGGAAAVLK